MADQPVTLPEHEAHSAPAAGPGPRLPHQAGPGPERPAPAIPRDEAQAQRDRHQSQDRQEFERERGRGQVDPAGGERPLVSLQQAVGGRQSAHAQPHPHQRLHEHRSWCGASWWWEGPRQAQWITSEKGDTVMTRK